MSTKSFKIGSANTKAVEVGPDAPLFLMAGPCVIEDKQTCFDIADKLLEISAAVDIPVIFKASFDKANRSSIESFRGPGIQKGLDILQEVRDRTKLPVMTDIHLPAQASIAAKAVDCLQIPAFLCRQTDLLVACAETALPVSVKKGQFLSPAEMTNVVQKLRSAGNDKIMLTERGTFFGYNRLVNDMTAIEQMKALGCPVIFDATHSTQKPGGLGNASAGKRELAPILAKAAIAAGANALFLEVHTNPAKAKCDAETIMPIEWVPDLLKTCKQIHKIIQ